MFCKCKVWLRCWDLLWGQVAPSVWQAKQAWVHLKNIAIYSLLKRESHCFVLCNMLSKKWQVTLGDRILPWPSDHLVTEKVQRYLGPDGRLTLGTFFFKEINYIQKQGSLTKWLYYLSFLPHVIISRITCTWSSLWRELGLLRAMAARWDRALSLCFNGGTAELALSTGREALLQCSRSY